MQISKTKMCIMTLCVMLFAMVTRAMVAASTTTVTALWDFQHQNPASLSGIVIEGNQNHVASTNSSISMFVIAKSGKFAVRTSDAQLNKDTYLRIPVKSTSDVVTVVSYPGYHNYTINGTAATSNTTTHTATSAEVAQGFVQLQATATSYLYSVKVVQQVSSGETTTGTSTSSSSGTQVTALWDFEHVNPSALSGLILNGVQGRIPSTLSDVSIFCIAQYGKFAQRTSDAQVNAKTALRVPVTTTSDVVTVTSYPGYHNYTIGGKAATADVTNYQATATDVSQGYVVIFGTATSYLLSIKAVLNAYQGTGQPTTGSTTGSTTSGSTTDNTTTASGNFTAVDQDYYIVSPGSASGFLSALAKANGNTSSSRKYIFLPDGVYDLGQTCLTAITGSKISIIGQSMDGTIIRNAPAVANEGISKTATLLNNGSYNYFQDLTIENALDYYNAGSAGRAVTLQDKGNYTICKNVRLKSYQDTYYSNNANGKFYFEDSDIHGTVDFICGGGDVFFNECTLTIEPRTKDGSGSCVIAAPYTQSSWGYVFNNCAIQNKAASYSLGRAWGGSPRLAYINTSVNDTKVISTRFTTAGMNVPAYSFKEYNTHKGTVVTTPSSNKVTFTQGTTSKTMETVLTATEAATYKLSNVLAGWMPNEDAAQLKMSSVSQSGNTIMWGSVAGASSYAIFRNGSFVAIVGKGTTSYTISNTGTYTVRASNPMGGFGTAASVNVSAIGSNTSSGSTSGSASGMSQYDLNAPIGWGTVGGTISGSKDQNVVTVRTADEFVNAMSGTAATTIYVSGTLTFSGQVAINGAQNKTVYGLPGSALVNLVHTGDVSKTGILMLKNSKNIILRNLTFKGAGAYDIDGKDNLTIQNCTYIWVDHCDFQDGVDGNFDLNNGTDNVSITWCRFRYLIAPWAGGSGGSNNHRFSNLIGGSDSNASVDAGKLRITIANCWWDEGCVSRMPRVRFGQVHIVNSLFSSSVATTCIGAGYRSNIYLEKSAFTSSAAKANAWEVYATQSGYTDYNITVSGNIGTADTQKRSGSYAYFNPSNSYSYSPYAANLVESVVSTYAGATLQFSAGAKAMGVISSETTAVADVEAATKPAKTLYFNINGTPLSSPRKGTNIVKKIYSNGKTTVEKFVVK